MGRHMHYPTEKTRKKVRQHASVGTPQHIICDLLGGMDPKTLRHHYRAELDLALPEANANVNSSLYEQAIHGNTAATIFWLKTRAGFKETSIIDNQSTDGSMTPKNEADGIDISALSLETRLEILEAHDAAKKKKTASPSADDDSQLSD